MDANRIEMQIAALLDKADVDQARVSEAIEELRAIGGALRLEVTGATTSAVKEAFTGLQGDIERARGAMKWFYWRWFFIAGATFIAFCVLGFFILWASIAWQRHELKVLLEQKTALAADIAEMQVNAEALAKKGARIKIEDCGGRRCIVASKRQGESETDWSSFWRNKQTGQPLVIPNGY